MTQFLFTHYDVSKVVELIWYCNVTLKELLPIIEKHSVRRHESEDL